jgi:hypothetical protein
MLTPKIRILKRNQIDDAKWNLAIQQAVNSLPYAYTWYLDALCSRWVGFIAGDYDFIMPLPIGRKWGILYVYQPLFCQQLGVFYKRRSETIIDLMLHTALSKFIFVNININFDNIAANPVKGLRKKKNLILTLSSKHSEIQKSYSDNTLRNIKKSQKAGIVFEMSDQKSFESYVDFYVANTAVRDSNFKTRHILLLKRLVQQFIIHNLGKLYLAKTPEGALCAGLIVLETTDRIIHLLPASDDYARQNGAMQFLTDAVLQHYSDSKKIYDFEGSSIDSIARFYEGFGARNEPFFELSKSPFKASKVSVVN